MDLQDREQGRTVAKPHSVVSPWRLGPTGSVIAWLWRRALDGRSLLWTMQLQGTIRVCLFGRGPLPVRRTLSPPTPTNLLRKEPVSEIPPPECPQALPHP